MESSTTTKEIALETIISSAIKLPGAKVNRKGFLCKAFESKPDELDAILRDGPVAAGITREELIRISKKHILLRTSQSSIASFAAGIPGGLAMAATIPLDVSQFFGMALRLAQELSYLYGAEDLWESAQLNEERVRSQLILYIGTMFGVSGAVSGVRVLSTQVAKTTLKKLPQKALTKTFWYPIVKKIGSAIGVKVTKTTVAQGISKVVPVVGGVISGTLNFASMAPMANRLQTALDKACFDYSESEFADDLIAIETAETTEEEKVSIKDKVSDKAKDVGGRLSGSFSKLKAGIAGKDKPSKSDKVIEEIEKYAKLRDAGILTEEEFTAKKKELLGL